MTLIKANFVIGSFLIILFVIDTTLSSTTQCPKPEDLYPCKCVKRYERVHDDHFERLVDIVCGGNSSLDLKSIFKKVFQTPTDKSRKFNKLIINNTAIDTIPQNIVSSTNGLHFESIIINGDESSKLKSIHKLAFFNIKDTVKYFEINHPGLESKKSPYDIMELIDTFSNAKSINITISDLDFTTKKLSSQRLESLRFKILNVNKTTILPNHVFYDLSYLVTLEVHANKLVISPRALEVKWHSSSAPMIDIILTHNNLNNTQFDKNTLTNMKRPVYLDLSWNKFKFLPENIFKPFLDADDDNAIVLNENPINCNDCRSFWALEYRNDSRIINAYCKSINSNNNSTTKNKTVVSIFDHDWSNC